MRSPVSRVLLLDTDNVRRAQLALSLRAAGLSVLSVSNVAEIERWPQDDVVVVEFSRFTPWWKEVGAAHVIVLTKSAAEGLDACRRGATRWLAETVLPFELVAAIESDCGGLLPPTTPAARRNSQSP